MRDSTDIVGAATERVTDVIQRLKDFAKLDQAEQQQSDLNALVSTTVATIQHELDGINLDTALGDVPPIRCVPRQINQVLVNLLLNAVAAVREGGDITITTGHVGDRVLVAVTDTGSGVDDKHIARIFDPGFTTRGVGVGAGLGLAIAHQIVSDHDGTIDVTSTLGEGSTFTVKLPA